MTTQSRCIGLAIVSMALLAATALAGKIITATQPADKPDKQPPRVIVVPGGGGAGDTPELMTGGLAATKPASKPAIDISPEARKVLDDLRDAYAKIQSLQLDGVLTAAFDVAGEKQDHTAPFTATFIAPATFKHEMKDDALIGSTGKKTYIYSPAEKMYAQQDLPKEKLNIRFTMDLLPEEAAAVLHTQNPSLVLALSRDADKMLAEDQTKITREPDASLDGKAYLTLKMDSPEGLTRVLIDPQTHFLRQMRVDLKAVLEKRGAQDVHSSLITYDYPKTTTDVTLKADDPQFAFAPPAGAREAGAGGPGEAAEGSPSALQDKPAPDFTLNGLDEKPVKLSDQKGSVVVLDFWATWCGPCRAELPHLEKIYKEKAPAGLKVFLLNQQEAANVVKAFVEKQHLTMPVLLDTQKTAVGNKYGVQGIPQTVIIGKDGLVKKVFVGFNPDAGEQELRAAIDAALAAKP